MTSTAGRAPSGRWLTVWPTGQTDLPGQLDAGGYLPDTARDTDAIPPAVAAHAIAAYSRPGRTVYDPDCGAGTVCVEALRTGRHTVGHTADPGSWELARGNVTTAKARGAVTDGMLLDRPPDRRSWSRLPRPVDLVLTTLRPDTAPGLTGPDPDPVSPCRLRTVLSGYRRLPRPGGRLVIVTRPGPCGDRRGDLASSVLTVGWAVGLIPVQRCVALTAALSGDTVALHLTIPASPGAPGRPAALHAHLDVIVFRRAAAGSQVARRPAPAPAAVVTPPAAADPHPRPRWTRQAA
jgi:hypothetical protein